MKILLLNQTFHPDVVATALYLSDLAQGLREKGHEVAVIAGSRAYDNLEKRFPARENWNGIEIYRIPSTAFGKGAKWRRAIDFASFMVMCGFKLLTIPRFDAVVSLTSPPLISVFGAAAAKLRGAKFYYWVMDLNPDEAIAAGFEQSPFRLECWKPCRGSASETPKRSSRSIDLCVIASGQKKSRRIESK